MSRLGPLAFHTNVTGTADSNPLSIAGLGTAAFQVTGTAPGTMVVQATIALGGVAPSNWITIRVINANSMAQSASITANGLYLAPVGGFTHVRVSITGAATAATVVGVVVDTALPDFFAGSGGGGGDVTNAGTFAVQVTGYTNTDGIKVDQGWNKIGKNALSNTKQQIFGGACYFGGYIIHNPNAATTFIQFFDNPSASVTVGTTTPDFVVGIPAGATANVEFSKGVYFSGGLTVAATTTATGNTAPSSTSPTVFFYKS